MTDTVLNEPGDTIDLSQLDLNNLTADPDQLLAQLSPSGEIPDDKTEDTEGSSPEVDQGEEQEEESPILSADGKHQIPYTVLRRERDTRRALEAEKAELQAQLEALQKAPPAQDKANPDPVADLDDADLKALEDEFPEIAKVTAATRAESARLRQEIADQQAKIDRITAAYEQDRLRQESAARDSIQAAIDAQPVLRYLQSEGDQSLWQAAVEIDQRLQNSPAWADKPMAERFEVVVKRLEEDFGPVQVPTAYQSPAAKTAPTRSAQAKRETPPISTLSDIQGGSSPEAGEVNVEAMSTDEIGEFFLKNPGANVNDLLARL